MNNGIIEMENGNYYHVERRGDTLVAGTACNWGIIPCVEIKYDEDISEDANLCNLYDALKEYDDRMMGEMISDFDQYLKRVYGIYSDDLTDEDYDNLYEEYQEFKREVI